MAAKTKAKTSKVAEAKTAEVKETVVAQEPQTVEENVTYETVTEEPSVGLEPEGEIIEKTSVETGTASEPEGEITEGVCTDEIIEPDTCDPMPKYNEDEVCDGDFETIQTDTPDVEEKPVSENKQGNLGYGYVYMWNGMASD